VLIELKIYYGLIYCTHLNSKLSLISKVYSYLFKQTIITIKAHRFHNAKTQSYFSSAFNRFIHIMTFHYGTLKLNIFTKIYVLILDESKYFTEYFT
jgi:hypothetical protein